MGPDSNLKKKKPVSRIYSDEKYISALDTENIDTGFKNYWSSN